jgi:hypothetical protein
MLSYSQYKNFTKLRDWIDIGIELCNIPHISEHCPKNVPSLFRYTEDWFSLPGYASHLIPSEGQA